MSVFRSDKASIACFPFPDGTPLIVLGTDTIFFFSSLQQHNHILVVIKVFTNRKRSKSNISLMLSC